MTKRKLNLILLFGIFSCFCYSQNNEDTSSEKRILNEKGDYYLDRYEFKKAIFYYNKSFKRDTNDTYPVLRMAEAYSSLEMPVEAEKYYRIAIENNNDISNEYLLKFALILLANEKYEESKHWLTIYNQLVDNDIRGEKYINSIENREELYRDSTIHLISNMKELNTSESEINPVFFSNQVIFASSRNTSIDALRVGYYDIFSANYSSSGIFSKIIPYNTSINTSYHEGPIAINTHDSLLYFTRNITETDNKSVVRLGIFKTTIPQKANETLSIIPISIKGFEYSIGHPSLNSDGTIMYFISDSPEGIGGLDIYRSKFINGEWSYPENLGKGINTKGDEMFPFVYHDSILYFSSTGHGGLGGLDIFEVNITERSSQVTNLGYPVNSSSDDFSLFLTDNGQVGYFSSNRPGGMGSDDIYKLEFLNLKIKGSLADAQGKELGYILSIKINTSDTDDDIDISSITTEGFSIIPGSEYILKIGKKGHTAEQERHLEIPLTGGIKYNFNNDSTAISDYRNKLNELLEKRKGIGVDKDRSINISLLSKELQIEEGEEYTFNLFPDSSHSEFPVTADSLITKLFIKDEIIQLTGDEQLNINMPYTSDQAVNIQTEIEYLDDNFNASEYNLEIDTIPFFSEITIDTTGLYLRYSDPDAFFENSIISDEDTKRPPDIIFRVQIAASRKAIPQTKLSNIYRGDKKIMMFEEEGWHKYYIAEAPTYFEAKQVLNDCGVDDAFIAAYKANNKLSLKDAMLQQYQKRMKESGRVIHDSIISIVIVNFDFDEFTLSPDEESYLDELVIKELNENSNYYVEINGHTDIRGSDIYNYGLSDERAAFVKELLVKKGIDKNRITTFSFGEAQLLKACDQPDDCDESVHRVNRRVEIVLFSPLN